MSKNIVFEGWLTKSPPSKRIWRTKWRRRWFALRQSGELPGQYLLDYFADRNCRRLKGTINLDLCEQVDAGLHMERGNGTLDPKLRGSVFTIQTQSRTYHLEADCEADMAKWVDAICRVCGLRPAEDSANDEDACPNNLRANRNETSDGTGPYIPISECVTGIRGQRISFASNNIVSGAGTPFNRNAGNRSQQIYRSQPQIKVITELSENESNLSDEESKSLTGSQTNIRDWSAAKSFTKLAISQKCNGDSEVGPPPPPRPPKTFAMTRESREKLQGPIIQEPVEINETSQTTQYYNLQNYNFPPAVDRALKPRNSSIGLIQSFSRQRYGDESKPDVLQYLDLDLHVFKPPTPSKSDDEQPRQKKVSYSAADTDNPYKTVDFLKTEAFNITRLDAEAFRSIQY